MEVLRRSSVFAAEVLDVFDRSLTEKELVSQSKALCRDYILSRLNQNGLGWSKSELNLSPSNEALTEVSLVLLCLGKTKPAQTSKNNIFAHCRVYGCKSSSSQNKGRSVQYTESLIIQYLYIFTLYLNMSKNKL